MYESIKEIVKSNEKEIIDAVPDNFTTFINISAQIFHKFRLNNLKVWKSAFFKTN